MATIPILLSLWLSSALTETAPPTLTIRDTIGKEWRDEPICWEFDLPRGHSSVGPVLVERDGKAIPAQGTVVEKHNDGSARRVEVRFLIGALAKGRSTELVCHLGKAGPRDTDLRITREPGALVLSNARTAVRVLAHNV